MKIMLIGMAGVGKSYIGKTLADALNYTFLDIDESVKTETGLGTTALLEKVGDERFLEIENQVFGMEMGKDNAVYAPGGSIIYCSNFTNNLHEFKIFYLKGDLNVITDRIKKQPRGIVHSSKMSIPDLFKERDELYTKYAHYIIDATRGRDEIVKDICDIIYSDKNNIC